MIRAATVTDVTPEGVWVVSSWLSGRTGPLFAVGLPAVGDAVLVVRTDDDALVVVAGGLPNGSVTSAKIADGTIVDADVSASAGIARSKIDGLPVTSTDNAVARFDGTGGALQNSGVVIADDGSLDGITYIGAVGPLYLSPSAGTAAQIQFRSGSSTRWIIRRNTTSESGSNAGSDLEIRRYNDSAGFLANAVTITRATGRVTIGDVGSTAGLEFGPSGPRDMAGSGSPEGVVSAPVGSTWRRTDGGAGTTVYLKESGAGNTGWAAVQPGLPTVHTSWSLSSWSAGTVTILNRISTNTELSSANFGNHFYDFQSNYFRVTRAGLYLISGIAGWSWSGDGTMFPMSGVFAATAGQYIDMRFWLDQASGGSAASRGFCTPYVSGGSQSHCSGAKQLPSAIGSSPTEIWAKIGVTRLGDAY